ncbi:MAG TPA: sensor domain-containing diguanylate cyclase [Streptosporangiaceae bacterium]
MESDGLARALLDALPDSTAVLDHSGDILAVNQAWRMFAVDNGGQTGATGVGMNYLELCERSAAGGCADAAAAAAGLRAVLDGAAMHRELEYACPSPAVDRWFLLRITPLPGDKTGAVASHLNITRRMVAERELAGRAATDPLTGLANRALLRTRLSAALVGHRDQPASPSRLAAAPVGLAAVPAGLAAPSTGLLYLDVDQLPDINDSYGHDAADEVLLTIGYRLRSQVRAQDTVARLGGGQFAVLAPRIGADALGALRCRVAAALEQPHLLHGHLVRIPVRIGVHLAALGDPADGALRRAGVACGACPQS